MNNNCRNFQELIDMGIITKLFFDPNSITSVNDLIHRGLITQVGMVPFVREWWARCDRKDFVLNESDLDNNQFGLG